MTNDIQLDDLPQPFSEGTVEPDALETDGDNPNEMSDEQFGLLCDRMADNGWLGGPIITDAQNLIADGEHRWRAAQEIGLTEVPVRKYDIDDATRRLWRQELNKIHGEHDAKRDALEYDHLLSEGYTEEVNALAEAAGEDLDELLAQLRMDGSRPAGYDYDPEHNVYFEDCVEGVAERLGEDSVDCLIADPPYGFGYGQGGGLFDAPHLGKRTLEGDGEEAMDIFDAMLEAADHAITDDAHLYVFSNWQTDAEFADIIRSHDYEIRSRLVWVKKKANNLASMGNEVNKTYSPKHETILFAARPDCQRSLNEQPDDVIEYARPTINSRDHHPTPKPVDLIIELIDNSTQPGELVLDPYMGSGTTAVAAIQNDRDYVGFEIDAENYREVIERRIGEAKRQREASVNQEAASADD